MNVRHDLDALFRLFDGSCITKWDRIDLSVEQSYVIINVSAVVATASSTRTRYSTC